HAVIALAALGASEARIEGYWEEYSKCTLYGYPLEKARVYAGPALTRETWTSAIGVKECFPPLHNFFTSEMNRLNSPEKLVQAYATELLPGMPGALTHGIIHLGWAIDAGSAEMTAEGAAYLAAVSLSVRPERFVRCDHADASPFASLLRASEAFHAADGPAWVASVKADPKFDDSFHPELKVAGFQREVAKVLAEGHPLVSEMPEWLYTHSAEDAMEQLYQCVTLLYLASAGDQAGRGTGRAPGAAGAGPGNFLTLHLLTSLWAVEHVMRPLDASAQGLALQCYWSMLLAIAITSNAGLPTRETLEVVLEKYPLAASSRADATGSIDSSEWKSVIDAAIAEEEEHNQKLVYVLSQLHQSEGQGAVIRSARF
ncbi:MAG: hypothetical protein SGPRY_002865, partial [Prymnesium sp.]